ncbi:hypothetical protein BLA29_007615 [Euroglyphus maynei]|uniref:Uncharacterized protein n=1 Tax=Euroglyphus maynei TaxID=6958 RepID=A0A1Y3BBY8_EURMA|nr:hypothetical protein BLA29_007615 [Euroglyphus maynei]
MASGHGVLIRNVLATLHILAKLPALVWEYYYRY